MAEGNRKDPRARVLNMTVRYKSATVDEFIENHSHDISRGGIFIKTRSPFPAGTLLKFEVRIAEDQKLMHGVGRVVWRREVDRAEESYPAGMGIKFIKTGEGAAELINQLVAAREGAESSFDAGVRESVNTPVPARPSAMPSAPAPVPPKPISASPTSSPALSVESGPRSLPTEAETAVTNPAKKRQDQSPEKRKVVLQGPALESPPSKPRPSPRPVAGAEASPQRPGRGSIAEETTARRTRPSAVKSTSDTPRWSGLVLILGLVGLVVFVINRMRGPSAEEEPTAAPTVAAEPAAPPAPIPAPAPIPPPVAEARPSDETAPAIEPEPPPVQPASATELSGSAGVAPAPAAPSGTAAAPAAAPAPAGTPAPAPNGTTAPAASAAPAPSKPPGASAPPSAATLPAPAPPAAKPPPPKPAPAPAKPAPKPSASVAPATPPAPQPDDPAPAPKPDDPAPAPPAAAAGSGGDTSNPTPPAKKPPAASSAPTPPAAAPPAAAPPPAAPPPPAPPTNDNPY
jgi:uncharacterized protein (TIGR02266 family)